MSEMHGRADTNHLKMCNDFAKILLCNNCSWIGLLLSSDLFLVSPLEVCCDVVVLVIQSLLLLLRADLKACATSLGSLHQHTLQRLSAMESSQTWHTRTKSENQVLLLLTHKYS